MHCSYCRSCEHTKRNCESYKNDLESGIAFAPMPHMPAAQEEAPEAAAQEEAPEAAQEESPEVAAQEEATAPTKRKRKLGRKKLEQIEAAKEYEIRKKRAVVFDENGDIDGPSIMEVPTRRTLRREEMPEESTFIAQHRETIPVNERASTALYNWRTARLATEGTTATRGRGRRRTTSTRRTTGNVTRGM